MRQFGGDFPPDHLKLIEDLERLEKWFHEHGDRIPSLSAAKGFVSIAHDYVMMDLEEVGDKFLYMAEEICPGYFVGPILSHINKDSDFASLVGHLTESAAMDTMEILGFVDE